MQIKFPIDPSKYIFKEKKFLNESMKIDTNRDFKIKFLGGYTQNNTRNWLEIFLRNNKILPQIEESSWGPFYQFLMDPNIFKNNPEMIIMFILPQDFYSSSRDSNPISEIDTIKNNIKNFVKNCQDRNTYVSISILDADFINFPSSDLLSFTELRIEINAFLLNLSKKYKNIRLFSVTNICIGFDFGPMCSHRDWYAFGQPYNMETSFFIGNYLSNIIRGYVGKSYKALVTDLDNTLWGGVIGDDGVSGIKLGDETPEGRIYQDIQTYILNLKKRGIFIATASKNEFENAAEGFDKSSSILTLNDFVKHEINWGPKSISIKKISKFLNIGIDSLVFIDDNPTEREEVRKACPEVLVPEVSDDPLAFLQALKFNDPFCIDSALTNEDFLRNKNFNSKNEESNLIKNIDSYEDFLKELKVMVEISNINKSNFDRTLQLNNKTNQFNFTTKRLTADDLNRIVNEKKKFNITYSASDKFSEYGLIGIVFFNLKDDSLFISNWIMSCRVFKKTIEHLILDEIKKIALKNKIKKIKIMYNPTPKNKILLEFLKENKFELVEICQESQNNTEFWQLTDIKNRNIVTYATLKKL